MPGLDLHRDYMSHILNSVKGGYIGDSRVDTRSFVDYSSYRGYRTSYIGIVEKNGNYHRDAAVARYGHKSDYRHQILAVLVSVAGILCMIMVLQNCCKRRQF